MALILRRIGRFRGGAEDYDVLSGDFVVGRIYRPDGPTPPEPCWHWSINGVLRGNAVIAVEGWALDRDEASASMQRHWDGWLAFASLRADIITTDESPTDPAATHAER